MVSVARSRRYGRMMPSLFLAALGLGLGAGCRPSPANSGDGVALRVAYVPIGSETLTPVTVESVESSGRTLSLRDRAEVEAVKEIILAADRASSPPGFSGNRVRVKVWETGNGADRLVAVIDNDGVVRGDGGYGMLSKGNMRRLKDLLEGGLR